MIPNFYPWTMEHGTGKNEKPDWSAQKSVTHPEHTWEAFGTQKSTVQKRKFCSFQTGEHNGNCELNIMRRQEEAAALNNNEPSGAALPRLAVKGRSESEPDKVYPSPAFSVPPTLFTTFNRGGGISSPTPRRGLDLLCSFVLPQQT